MYENSIPLEKYESLLADIRDMFPVPPKGSALEESWAGAMASAEYVPAYVKECLGEMFNALQKKSTSHAYDEWISDMTIVSQQLTPVVAWCAGCSPENCEGCGGPAYNKPPTEVEQDKLKAALAQVFEWKKL